MNPLYLPFAITARTMGCPKKLFTPLMVINLDCKGEEKIAATVVNAMWDTGAECCIMTSALASRLGIDFSYNIKSLQADTTAAIGAAVSLVSLKYQM